MLMVQGGPMILSIVDPLLKGFDLTAQEKADLVAFLMHLPTKAISRQCRR